MARPDETTPSSANPLDGDPRQRRRAFMVHGLMGGGLLVSQWMAVHMGYRYLQPVERRRRRRFFLAVRSELEPGSALSYELPSGQIVHVIHAAQGFTALSDVCPHLGCRVHWDSSAGEFVCPCHDGRFDRDGKPLSGPPADMEAGLRRLPVVEEDGLLYLELPSRA